MKINNNQIIIFLIALVFTSTLSKTVNGQKKNDLCDCEPLCSIYDPLPIRFPEGSSQFFNKSIEDLNEIIEILSRCPYVYIKISGYTDNNETTDFLTLSESRVNSVKEYLISHGIKKRRIKTAFGGARNPIAMNSTPEGREYNRRVEYKYFIPGEDKKLKENLKKIENDFNIELSQYGLSLRFPYNANIKQVTESCNREMIVTETNNADSILYWSPNDLTFPFGFRILKSDLSKAIKDNYLPKYSYVTNPWDPQYFNLRLLTLKTFIKKKDSLIHELEYYTINIDSLKNILNNTQNKLIISKVIKKYTKYVQIPVLYKELIDKNEITNLISTVRYRLKIMNKWNVKKTIYYEIELIPVSQNSIGMYIIVDNKFNIVSNDCKNEIFKTIKPEYYIE